MTEILPGRYAVAGSSGLVGGHVLKLLAGREGVAVRALHHTRPAWVQAENITPFAADLSQSGTCAEAMQDVDYLLLCAGVLAPAPVLAKDPIGPAMANLSIVSECLRAAWRAGVKKVVWLSSATVYPDADVPLEEALGDQGDPPGGWYAIGWTMRYLEKLARACVDAERAAAAPMACAVLRPSLIYGENDHFDDAHAHFVPALIRRVAEREKPIEIWGTGEQRRDIIHAEDVARAAVLALHMVERFDVFNIASGASVSVNEIAARLVALDGYHDAEIIHLADKATPVKDRSMSNRKARDILGFSPCIGLDDGLARTLAWYKAHRGVL